MALKKIPCVRFCVRFKTKKSHKTIKKTVKKEKTAIIICKRTERFVTGYQSGGMHHQNHMIIKTYIAEPNTFVPGHFDFTYIVVNKGEGKIHAKYLTSKEVSTILKYTRFGRSLHSPQTRFLPYVTEFLGFTEQEKKDLGKL